MTPKYAGETFHPQGGLCPLVKAEFARPPGEIWRGFFVFSKQDLGIFKMAGVKGRSGTNKGKDKPWAEALRMVMFEDDKKALRDIALACKDAALKGDMVAIREIGDRLDGKPAQAVEMTGELEHRYVARMPAKTPDMDEWQKQHALSMTTLQ